MCPSAKSVKISEECSDDSRSEVQKCAVIVDLKCAVIVDLKCAAIVDLKCAVIVDKKNTGRI